MTYGIDVSRNNSSLNFGTLPNDEFVIVKLGGTNVSPMYTSVTAKQQAADARRAGKRVGWYWVTGNAATVAEQAKYAASALKQVGYQAGDLVALDDEVLDSHGQIWGDTSAAAWLVSVRGLLGCDYRNLALYGSTGSLFRPRLWPQVKKLGVLIWVAAYGSNNGVRVAPDMGRSGLSWTIHQFTSNYRGSLDRNYMVKPVGAVFRSYSSKPAPVTPPHVAVPKTSTSVTGGPGGAGSYCWKRLQLFARQGGYQGPVDGDLGALSWHGIQARLKTLGFYRGVVDGVPGPLTVVALQRWAGVAKPVVTGSVLRIGRPAWRKIGAKLNSL